MRSIWTAATSRTAFALGAPNGGDVAPIAWIGLVLGVLAWLAIPFLVLALGRSLNPARRDTSTKPLSRNKRSPARSGCRGMPRSTAFFMITQLASISTGAVLGGQHRAVHDATAAADPDIAAERRGGRHIGLGMDRRSHVQVSYPHQPTAHPTLS